MKNAKDYLIVLITAPELRTARALAGALLNARLAACVNIVPGLESHYRWKGKLEKAREVLLVVKTNRRRLPTLEKRVLALHPYDTPEILAVGLNRSTPKYLAWLAENL